MGITSKNFQMYIWIFLEFSMRLCCTFVREYPLPSFVFLMFIVLYVFLSSVFWFLIYSLPLVLIAGVIFRVICCPECPKDGGTANRENVDPKSPRKIRFAEDEEKKKKSVGRAQSVRRRKSKKDFPPYVEEDGGSIFPSTGFSDHDMVDKSALTEENMKDIREVEVHSVGERAGCSSSDASQSLGGTCVDGFSKDWQKSFRSRDEGENEITDDSENEEAARQDRNKGVQWTQDDQKNLMDLSEMERNKRLESLIARRRARRLVSLHVRRTLMNLGSDDPPISIVIPRTNSGSSGPFSPGPGSAPSVLLPNRNPFDLPYDQHEEKPNLRGGSFQQDFMVAYQDLMFCRHESFSLGAAFSGDFNSDAPPWNRIFEASENYRSKTPFGNEDSDTLIQQVLFEEPEKLNRASTSAVKEQASADHEEDGSEVQIKAVLIEDIDDRTSSSSSSEEDEPFYRIDKDAILKCLSTPSAPRNITVDSQENSQVGNLPNPGPSMSQNARMEGHYYYASDAMLPTPSHSIASDLQVEVSEVGSPPRSVDGMSSVEDEISVYNREMEKDTTCGNEGTWVASSRLSRLDENESRSREVREVTEQDLVKVGFSNINRDPTLNILPERVIQQDSVDSHSFAPAQAHKSEENSASIDENDILELIKRNTHEKHGAELTISEASESHADLEASFPPEPVIEQADACFSSLSSPMTVSQSNFLTDQEGSSNLDEQAEVEVQEVNGHKTENDTSNPTTPPNTNLLLNDSMAQHSFSPSETDKTEENSTPVEKNDIREVTQDRAVESASEKGFSAASQSGHDPQRTLLILESAAAQVPDVSSSSMSPKSQSKFSMNQESSSNFVNEIHFEDQQYGFAERHGEDAGFSMVNESSNDPKSVVEQLSTSSSSSSSPESISQTKFSMDLGSSNLDQEKQMKVPQFKNQITETLTHQATDDISNPTTSHESGQLLADPTVHQILDRPGNTQKSSNDHKKSSDEASTDNHVNASMVREREILNADSIKGTTAYHSESYNHKKSSKEASANNHINPSVIQEDIQNKDNIIQTEGLPKLETSAHHSESHDRKKYSEEVSTSNHTNASVIPEEILKIDSIKETEGLPKPEMTTNQSESYDHENSSEETSSDNHTDVSVIQEEIQNIDSIKETEKLEMTEGELLHLDAGRGPQGPSVAENKGAEMIKGATHLEGTVEKPAAEMKLDVNNVVEVESRTFSPNEVSNINVSKAAEAKNEATPYLSEKPTEDERKIPNLNIVDEVNNKAPNFQGSHEGESQGLHSPDPSQVSQSVYPRKVQDVEGED